jgi:hypothetical protein
MHSILSLKIGVTWALRVLITRGANLACGTSIGYILYRWLYTKSMENQIVPPHALCSGISNLVYIYNTAGKGAEASNVSNTLAAPIRSSSDLACYGIMYRSRKHQEHVHHLSTSAFHKMTTGTSSPEHVCRGGWVSALQSFVARHTG